MRQERDALVAELTIPGVRSAADAATLVDALLGKPHPTMPSAVVDAALARIMIRNSGMLDLREATGWLRRDGTFLPCGNYAHDRLVHCLGMTTHQVEGLGWARLTTKGVSSTYRLGPRQRTAIRDMRDARFVVDDDVERAKPVPPAFERSAPEDAPRP